MVVILETPLHFCSRLFMANEKRKRQFIAACGLCTGEGTRR